MTLYEIWKRDILLCRNFPSFRCLRSLKKKWLHRLLNDYRPIIDEFTRAASSNGVNSSYVGGTICSRVTENFSPGTYCDDPYRFTLGEFHLETSCFFLPCVMIRSSQPIKTHTYNGRFLYLYRLYLYLAFSPR